MQAEINARWFAVLVYVAKKKPLKTLFSGVLSQFLIDGSSIK